MHSLIIPFVFQAGYNMSKTEDSIKRLWLPADLKIQAKVVSAW